MYWTLLYVLSSIICIIMHYIFVDVFAGVTLKLWSFSFELICIIIIKCARYVISISWLNSLIVARWFGWHGVCWRKICTSRQAHSKPKKLASHAKRSQDVPVNFPWKLTKDKVVKFQSLELAGWYQTVPYLRLKSQVRWHIAIKSYLPTNWNHSGALKGKK
jgi:hypothetical protein